MTLLLLLRSPSGLELTAPSGLLSLEAPVPTLTTGADFQVPSGLLTLAAAAPVLESAVLAVPSGLLTLVAPVPDLDTEGIVWLPADATAPRDLASVAFAAAIDWPNDSVVLRAYGGALDFDPAADLYATDLNDELASGGGYTAGGLAVTSKSLEVSGTHTRLLSADVEIASASFSVAYLALIDVQTAIEATSPVLAVYDLNGLKTLVAEPFVVSPGDEGWLYGISAP